MTENHKLLDEFKELIEAVSLEIIKEAQMKEVAKDVVTRSYKTEIADALEVISEEVERLKHKLQGLDYISEEEIKALVYTAYEKQVSALKENEEQIKNTIAQNTQELYIANEKLRSEVTNISEQVAIQLTSMNQSMECHISTMQERHRVLKDCVEANQDMMTKQIQKLFYINYGLVAVIMGLLIFLVTRGNYGN